MKDYKHHMKTNSEPIKALDMIGCGCFLILMFLPFSREAWALLIEALV